MNFNDIKSIDDLLKIAMFGDEKDNYNYTDTSVVNQKEEDETPEGVSTPVQTQQYQPTKQAKLEVLLKSITVDEDGTIVSPITCPGIGRVNDYLEDDKGQPACVFHDNNCPYFEDAGFDLNTQYKQISCRVGNKEGS